MQKWTRLTPEDQNYSLVTWALKLKSLKEIFNTGDDFEYRSNKKGVISVRKVAGPRDFEREEAEFDYYDRFRDEPMDPDPREEGIIPVSGVEIPPATADQELREYQLMNGSCTVVKE